MWIVSRAKNSPGWVGTSAPDFIRYSPRLNDAWRETASCLTTFSRRAGLHVGLSDRAVYSFGPEHVPQLLWLDTFEARFADISPPRVLRDTMRRFLALALLRTASPLTWQEASAALELPVSKAFNSATCVAWRVKAAGLDAVLSARLHVLAQELDSAGPQRINYGLRRQALLRLDAIPDARWVVLCAEAGVAVGRRDKKRRQAATWLWAELTGGDYRLSPYLRAAPTAERGQYVEFVRRALPPIEAPLRQYGSELLSGIAAQQ